MLGLSKNDCPIGNECSFHQKKKELQTLEQVFVQANGKRLEETKETKYFLGSA